MTPVIGHVAVAPEVGLVVEVMDLHDGYFDAMFMTPGIKEGRPVGYVGKVMAMHGLEEKFVDVSDSREEFLRAWADWLGKVHPLGTVESALTSFVEAWSTRRLQ